MRHAERELEILGYLNETGDELGDDMNIMMADNVLELIRVFSEQGHSGFSAPYCISLFNKLARFEIIAPLTGRDDEWNEICDERTSGNAVWQNNRDSRVFKESDGRAYFIEGIVWEDRNGCSYTSRDSRVYIDEFPYIPKTEYRKDYEDDEQTE
jgi:hypothetical protein